MNATPEEPRIGIRRGPFGKLHVPRPGLRPRTRCGLQVTGPTVEKVPIRLVPPAGRCKFCFPASARSDTTCTDPQGEPA